MSGYRSVLREGPFSLAVLATLSGAAAGGVQSVSSEETARSVQRMLERLPYRTCSGGRMKALSGRLTMVGAGGGSIPFDFFKMPPGAQLATSLNGGTIALMEVVEMAAPGRLKVLVDRYPLSAATKAYDDFEHGRLVGRAVLMPASLQPPAADGETTDSSRIAPVTAGA